MPWPMPGRASPHSSAYQTFSRNPIIGNCITGRATRKVFSPNFSFAPFPENSLLPVPSSVSPASGLSSSPLAVPSLYAPHMPPLFTTHQPFRVQIAGKPSQECLVPIGFKQVREQGRPTVLCAVSTRDHKIILLQFTGYSGSATISP